MEFKSLKNIETSFRQIRTMAIAFVVLCALVTGYALWSSYSFAEKQREKIYVLDNGKSLILALSQDLSQNRPVEAREHVRRFHELFFTLSPDKAAIEGNIRRALYLCDESAFRYYKDWEEKGNHLGEHQPDRAGGQRGVRLRALPLYRDDLCPPVARQEQQHHRAQSCNPLPPAELGAVGQQSSRFHDGAVHHSGEPRFTDHRKVKAYGKDKKVAPLHP